MNPLYAQILGSITRAVLTAFSAYLIERHIVTAVQGEQFSSMLLPQIVNAIPGMVALAWSVWQKRAGRIKLVTSLMKGEITEKEVDDHIKGRKARPPVLSPPSTVPQAP